MTGTILLIGATGFFGQRLAAEIASLDGVDLVVTSRSLSRAEELAAQLRDGTSVARVRGLALDVHNATEQVMQEISPWLVIDASGPFQRASYGIAEVCLRCGAHVIDLADARDYILGYHQALHELAVAQNACALTGASSSPALSFAAVDDLTRGWSRVDTIDIAITPGGKSDVGPAVLEAVLSYAGAPVPVFVEGRLQTTLGWGSVYRLPMPGLGKRWVSPVETADAEIMAERFAVTSRVRFHAGLESWLEHFGLLCLAKIRGRWPSINLKPIAHLLGQARKLTRLTTSDSGGMVVTVHGFGANGKAARAQWSLLARDNLGPNVPILPALALVRQLLAGEQACGAYPAAGRISLQAIETELTRLGITTKRDMLSEAGPSVFDKSLAAIAQGSDAEGNDGHCVPAMVKAFHDRIGYPVWGGRAEVTRGRNPLTWLIGRIMGLPHAGGNQLVTVSVDRIGDRETWTRNFSGKRFRSFLSYQDGKLFERFGLITFELGIRLDAGRIRLPVKSWRIWRIPLPLVLAPRSDACEYEDEDGRFRFDVRLSLPLIGLLAHYRGWLEPQTG